MRERGIESDADLGPLLEDAALATSDHALHQRLQHMFDAGAWVLVESSIADLPADLRWLFESGAVTLDELARIHRTLGATSVTDLATAVREGAIRNIAGLDEDVEAAVADALPELRAAIPRISLGRATAIVEPILARLRANAAVLWALPGGSLRRGQDTVGDIEIVAASADPASAIEELTQLPDIARILHRSARRLYLLIDRVQVGIRFPDPATAGTVLVELTGSLPHLNALRGLARERGVTFPPEAASEEVVYAALGLPFIEPEIRNGDDEIRAAREGRLPKLVSRSDIRGDLHMHTAWSDGRDSIEEMVEACRRLGYEYLAITDHSPHSAASRNLSIDGVKRQADEIAALRDQYPDVAILHGCEVDILTDGRLDFPDRVLQQFDIVLASLHDSAGHSPDQLLRRYESAMRNPLVMMITHPTNRLVPQRRGYDLDYDRLFGIAVETGTVVEIDGAPSHLDLDSDLSRKAVTSGVTVSIDSDSHRTELLDRQMELGVLTARRGWVEPRHVLNTRSLAEIRDVIARKRGR